MKLSQLPACGKSHKLLILGGFHESVNEVERFDSQTVLLFGPTPDFWDFFTQSPEWKDGKPDAMDRWSLRVLTDMAQELGGEALFPFGGAPFLPFFTWALKSGQAWQSPVNLLVHAEAGLMVSYRGAIALPYRVDLPEAPEKPCATCHKPCLTACLSGALDGDGYDVPACKDFLRTEDGAENMSQGCAVRRACPISQSYARMEAQSAYHMRIFVGESR